MLNQVLKVSSGTCQQFIKVAVTFLDFRLLQGSVATYCSRGENLYVCRREFSYESPGERILKIGAHCQRYYQTSSGLLFLRYSV